MKEEKEKDRLEKSELLTKIQKLKDDLEEVKGAKDKEYKDKYDQSVNKFFEW